MPIPEQVLRQARQSGTLNLSGRELSTIEASVWELDWENFDKRPYELEKIGKAILDNNSLNELSPSIVKFKELKSLSINNNQLTALPPEMFSMEQLKMVFAQHNKLSGIPEQLASAPEIGKLDLAHNAIASVASLASQSLGYLDLSNNVLASISLGSLPSLSHLDLSCNQLSDLPSGIFESTPALAKLDLSQNQFITLPDNLGTPASLVELNVERNKLTSLGKGFGGCKALVELNLSHNKFTQLPPCVFEMEGLQLLQAHTCKLKTLPTKLGEMAELARIDVSSNEIRTLPAELGQMPKLTSLNVQGNLVKTIPRATLENPNALATLLKDRASAREEASGGGRKAAGNQSSIEGGKWTLKKKGLDALPEAPQGAEKLTEIDVSFNKLKELPDMAPFSGLVVLAASNNELSALPESLAKLPLRTLELTRNNLSDLSVLSQLGGSLQTLAIGRNPLSMPTVPFDSLKDSLQHLDLSGLSLTAVPTGVFALHKLRTLVLDSNALESLPGQEAVDAWPNLDELDLSNNNIARLPLELGKLQLRQLGWAGNPLRAPNRAVANRGTQEILKWLRARLEGGEE